MFMWSAGKSGAVLFVLVKKTKGDWQSVQEGSSVIIIPWLRAGNSTMQQRLFMLKSQINILVNHKTSNFL